MKTSKEIRNLSEKELENLINDNLNKLRDLRFKTASNQVKNVKEISAIKKEIARAKTFLNQK